MASNHKADAIVVLGAAVRRDGRPSPALERRLAHGVALWRAGCAPVMVLSGGIVRNPPAEALLMAELAMAAGVPAQALVCEDQSRNTLQNAERLVEIVAARGWDRLLLVTDRYHMGRARYVFGRHGLSVACSPAARPPGGSWIYPQLREWAARPVYWWRLRHLP